MLTVVSILSDILLIGYSPEKGKMRWLTECNNVSRKHMKESFEDSSDNSLATGRFSRNINTNAMHMYPRIFSTKWKITWNRELIGNNGKI